MSYPDSWGKLGTRLKGNIRPSLRKTATLVLLRSRIDFHIFIFIFTNFSLLPSSINPSIYDQY